MALMIAGAVGTIVISPTPTEPFVPRNLGVSLTINSISKAVWMLGNLKVAQSLVCPAMLFAKGVACTHIRTAFQLAFKVLRMDYRTAVHCSGHLEDLDLTGFRVYLHFGHLQGVYLGFKRGPLAGLRVSRAFFYCSFGTI